MWGRILLLKEQFHSYEWFLVAGMNIDQLVIQVDPWIAWGKCILLLRTNDRGKMPNVSPAIMLNNEALGIPQLEYVTDVLRTA